MEYKTLKDLKAAYEKGEVTEPVRLDNDATFVYQGDDKVFDGGNPEDLLVEALDLLGIPNEQV